MKTKSALSYFGSDSEVAPRLAAMLDDCKHVTIPFCGGMSILPFLKARAIVANDLHSDVINFYRVLHGCYGKSLANDLIDRCQHTLSHPDEMKRACDIIASKQGSFVGRAWAFWAQCWIGRKGKGGTKKPSGLPSVRRTASGGTNASRIRAAADDLHAWATHLERCEFECLHFRELLPKVADDAQCGIYCDPPWVNAGDNYAYSFEDPTLHTELRNLLSGFKRTKVVVRYGDHPFIRGLYSNWKIIDAFSRDQCNAVKGEIWITNRQDEDA